MSIATVPRSVRVQLLQVRDRADPMRLREVECFARALGVEPERIEVRDLLALPETPIGSGDADLFLIGGSGDYSVLGEGEWLGATFDLLRALSSARRPTFASCWGFQALALALGGRVVHDLQYGELGSYTVRTTAAGRMDPVFAPLGECFLAQVGHEDTVVELPPRAVGLASTERVEHHAYRIEGSPIYATQFHPELARADLEARIRAYPRYAEEMTKRPVEEVVASLEESPETLQMIGRFARDVFG